LPFLIAELENKASLEEAIVNLEGFKKLAAQGITTFVHILTRSNDEFDIWGRGWLRMFELNWQMEGSLGESLSKKSFFLAQSKNNFTSLNPKR